MGFMVEGILSNFDWLLSDLMVSLHGLKILNLGN
jgi:hypothetical protein